MVIKNYEMSLDNAPKTQFILTVKSDVFELIKADEVANHISNFMFDKLGFCHKQYVNAWVKNNCELDINYVRLKDYISNRDSNWSFRSFRYEETGDLIITLTQNQHSITIKQIN